ncbi:hypothetical protein POM88_043380 [Heracleum sosnowskyi]|uniref:Uncharacterized protein n=1 Tax=Heracleum sosnowskyi TaxID=360622 RepID=A0AAD8M332_9APIA|nr:hypothetical protein POM88_043380 [Heracleum sosnowskyi]
MLEQGTKSTLEQSKHPVKGFFLSTKRITAVLQIICPNFLTYPTKTPEETKLALCTRLDRPFYYERDGFDHITQFHHMKSRKIYTKLWRVEQEITEKLQKLKMECFGDDCTIKERQLLKKIDQAREEVEKISPNSPSEPATRIYTWRGDILDTKEALTDYIKVTTRELKELRMKQVTYRAYDGRAELEKAVTEKEIRVLERKLENVKQKKVQVSELQLKMKI